MRPAAATVIAALAALAGLFFSAMSTYDFVAHLDRDVHGIHCSFVPGLEAADVTGSSGCAVTMMSPYSSVLRASIWGGLPVSIPSMSVFAFLLFWSLALVVWRRQDDARATGFLALSTLVPLLTSLVMGYLSLTKLDAACKLCIGIYASSLVASVAALALWLRARKRDPRRGGASATVGDAAATVVDAPPVSMASLAAAFATGVAFVAVPAGVYAAIAPDFSRFVGACGALSAPGADADVLVDLGGPAGGIATIEVLDPLCPSCKAFEERLGASGLEGRVRRSVLLFPLDSACNWMVSEAVHPGACTVSEAVLCANEDGAVAVIDWALEHQQEIREATAADAAAAARMVREAFPRLSGCVGSAAARAKVNRSLRWAVANQLPVLTPQVYVDGQRLCDADTDLGMDYALSRLLDRQGGAR